MAEKRKDSRGRILRDGEHQRENGKYEYKYDYFGSRKTVYSWKLVPTDKTPQGKREDLSLREKEKAIQSSLDSGIDSYRAAKTSFNELFRMYLGTKAKIKDTTREHYKKLWKLHIEGEALGKMMIPNIKKVHIQHFYSMMHKAGEADATIRMYHNNLINPSLQFAVDNDLIRKNPAKGCMEGFGGYQKREALTVKEQQEFIKFVSGNNAYKLHLPMIRVMLGTACRIGEISGLTWDDVDMKKRMISINHQLQYSKIDGQAQYYISTPKTESGIRQIPMTEQVYKAFLEQKRLDLLLGRRGVVTVEGYDNFVFLNGNGKPYTISSFNAVLGNIVQQYNKKEEKKAEKEKRDPVLLPHISNHILRHTGCTRMAEAGIDPKVLQVIMGHSDISVTMKVYNHVDNERMKKEIQRIELAV